ncbi:hypothetical protein QOZ80_8BG0655480 [Eleusine coracana subsp. coracana]|nr:hypothetical protein QOZ80_8BG0655480 [Eleusine coracana subsp. coracana]
MSSSSSHHVSYTIPVIDMLAAGVVRYELVARVKEAVETAGFYQVVNHGVPETVMWKMLTAVQGFTEEPAKVKRPYYTRDAGRRVRDIVLEYTRPVHSLCSALLELLSEAMGLHRGRLEHDSGCMDWLNVAAHYYPPCPEPHLTVGTAKHSDAMFLTVLFQAGPSPSVEGPGAKPKTGSQI